MDVNGCVWYGEVHRLHTGSGHVYHTQCCAWSPVWMLCVAHVFFLGPVTLINAAGG